jgi:hypothetical protein
MMLKPKTVSTAKPKEVLLPDGRTVSTIVADENENDLVWTKVIVLK